MKLRHVLSIVAAIGVTACGSEDWNPLVEEDEKGKESPADQGEIYNLDELYNWRFEEPGTRFQVQSITIERKEGHSAGNQTFTFTYNGEKLLILKEVTSKEGVVLEKEEFTYNAQGQMLTENEYRTFDRELSLAEEKTFAYDGDGNMIHSTENSYWRGQPTSSFEVKLDIAGGGMTFVSKDYEEGVLTTTETEVCTFTGAISDGNSTCETTDQDGKVIGRSTSTAGHNIDTEFDEDHPEGFVASESKHIPGKFGVLSLFINGCKTYNSLL